MMQFHPLADIFPLLEGREYTDLVEDIRTHGLNEAIVVLDDQVLDGRNRMRACVDAGIQYRLKPFIGDDPVAFVISANIKRRHLDSSQRAMVAARLATMRSGSRTDLSPVGERSQSQAAELLNVGKRTVERAGFVRERATPELVASVERGEVSVSAAADVAQLPHHEQRDIVARGEKEILAAAKRIRSEKAEQRRAENESLKASTIKHIPDGRYETIVIDPPWDMQKIERDVRPNQVAFDYPTMTEEELVEFPVQEFAADDCHLFCWTTQKFLPSALRLLSAWGFRYCLTMVWHKPGGFQPIGLPQYNCEFVVYGRRGSPDFVETKAFPCCFHANRREHSRKPDEFYELIKRTTGSSRIDVFSRELRDGYEQFGNETGKFA